MTELEQAQRTEMLELKVAYAAAISQRDAAEARLQEVYESVRHWMSGNNQTDRKQHDDYWWFVNHPALQYDNFHSPWIEFTPQMVDPVTRTIEYDLDRNTKIEWWIECGPWCYDEHNGLMHQHDWDLDCGGDTIGDALAELRRLVTAKYGDYDDE